MAVTPLSDSASQVFAALARLGRATRPRLATACALSKPTVSAAIAELEAVGLAERNGTSHGTTGRSAAVYRLGAAAGYALAVDCGSTQTALRALALDGTVLDERQTDDPGQAHAVVRAALERRSGGGPLRAVVVAVPDATCPAGTGDPAVDDRVRATVGTLRLPPGPDVRVENNVNCAAVAELHEGAHGDRDTFVHLQVGVGIGAGVVVGGRLLRGANGAAGEVARLAYPWADGAVARREALEARLGSAGLLRRVRGRWSAAHGPVPEDAAALFALAGREHPLAAELVAEHAREVGRLAASICAVLDPGLVVLGGGVGSNPLLTPGVAATVRELSWPTRVVVSRLGDRATVIGAAHLAREHSVHAVTGAA